MEVFCPNCENLVPLKHVGLFSSTCPKCGTKFNNVKSYNQSQAKETIESYSKITTYPEKLRPAGAKSVWEVKSNRAELKVKSAGLKSANTKLTLIITIFLSVFTFILHSDNSVSLLLYLSVLSSNIITLLIFLYLCIGKVSIFLDDSEIRMKKSILGISYAKTKKTRNFLCVKEVVTHQEGSGSGRSDNERIKMHNVYGVGIIFKDLSYFSFGANLNEEEKGWLLFELNSYLQKLTKD